MSRQKKGALLSGMADVGNKDITLREALACCTIFLPFQVIQAIKQKEIPKGDVLEIARVAGIMAVKNTPSIIPHCHPIHIVCVKIDFKIKREAITTNVLVRARDRTGVEMEALHGASAVCLSIYDLCKFMGYDIAIGELMLLKKSGGKSGTYERCTD